MLPFDIVEAALGKISSDICYSNCFYVDFYTNSIRGPASITIYKGYIVGINENLPTKQRIDLDGLCVCPGLVDAHVHIESSLVHPREFCNLVTPHGTLTVIADPHEIANVLGYDGIHWMLKASEGIPLEVFFMAPSCVPATSFDTAGASLYASDLAPFTREPRVLGLGEVMNYPGILSGDLQLRDKLSLFWENGKVIDGHSPGLSGKELSAYIISGIRSDHEATTPEEALEKLSKGMWIMARFGSSARDLEHLVPAMSHDTVHRMMLCTDDRHPHDIVREGHIDAAVRILQEHGIPLIDALRMAAHNPSLYFGLRRSGSIAPGYRANLIAFNLNEPFSVEKVIKEGTIIAEQGEKTSAWTEIFSTMGPLPRVRDSVNVKWLDESAFTIPYTGKKIRVIDAVPGSIVTGKSVLEPAVENGLCVADPARDLLKLFVIERHGGTGSIGKGFIRGLGLKHGAIGSTVSHDSHNIIVAGADDISIFKAVKRLNAMKGGYVITDRDTIIAELPLPIAGLMSDRSISDVLASLERFSAYFEQEGIQNVSPLMLLSFMALPVIPSLKLTDQGLVDVESFKLVDLFVEE